MRADRLLSMLMLLQARGRMTAERLAEELEVSIRTIYRDVIALESAGVPLISERGPGGGIALLDAYKTTLTGLTEGEARALFMLSVPATFGDLGVKADLQQALRKLSATVATTRQDEHRRVRQRILLDASPWQASTDPGVSLQVVQRALWDDSCLAIRYELAWSAVQARIVLPLGLVAKANRWYLVCTWGEGPRVIEMARLVAARPCEAADAGSALSRPPDFDLETFWTRWCGRAQSSRAVFEARVRVAPELHAVFRYLNAGEGIETLSHSDADGWFEIRLTVDSFEAARTRVLGWGGAARVIAPAALRESVVDFARQVMERAAVVP